MNADAILKKIEQDARQSADAIRRDAQARADAAAAAYHEKARREDLAALERARKDALALDDRMQRMAELDARKALLAAKREVLDEAFSMALQKMQAMPEKQAKRFAMGMLLSAARGDETLVADAGSAWCDDAFVADANRALKEAGREGKLTLSAEKASLGGGFLLKSRGLEINCSFPAAVQARRNDLEAEVASMLFGE